MVDDPPITYFDSVWELGLCCYSIFLGRLFYEEEKAHGPFTWVGSYRLKDVVDTLLNGCEGMLDDVEIAGWTIVNPKKKLLLPHLFPFPTCRGGAKPTPRWVELGLPFAKRKLERRKKRFYTAMKVPDARPLFVYYASPMHGGAWEPVYDMLGEPDWGYNPEEAKEALETLRKAYTPHASLIYFAYDPSLSSARIDELGDGLLLGRHPYKVDSPPFDRELIIRLKYDIPELTSLFRYVRNKQYFMLTEGRVAFPTFKERLSTRIRPEVKGKVQAYVFTHYAPGNQYYVGQLFNYIPLFLWSVLYAQEEGVEEIKVVTRNSKVRYISQSFGFSTLTPEEWEKEEEADYIVLLHGSIPFHKPGMVREMLKRAEEGEMYIGTPDIGIEVINTRQGSGGGIVSCNPIYLHRVTQMKMKDVLEEMVHLYGGEKDLQPTLIKTIAVVQNQHDWDYDFTPFLDSCDLVMRVNFMDSWITGRYGERCDLLICGDSSYFLQQRDTLATLFSHFPTIPIIYATRGGLIFRREVKHGYSLYAQIRETGTEWTTTLFGLYYLLRAFPRAQMYTTGIRSLIQFNKRSRHDLLAKANGGYLWSVLEELGKVIDITTDEERERYGKKIEGRGDIIRVETPKWKDEVCINTSEGMCIRKDWQHLGILAYPPELEEGDELAIKWLYDGAVEVYKERKDGIYEPKQKDTRDHPGEE